MRITRGGDTALGALLAALLLAANVGSVSARLGFLHKPKQVKEYDHWRYIEMAREAQGRPALQHEPPYCFRLAVPWLAARLVALGLTENAAFFLLTNAVLFGFLLVLWLHLRDLGFGLPLRATGLVLVGLTQGAVRWFEYQYWMTDPAALFLAMLAFHLVERGRTAALAPLSVAAAFVRETYVLVYPYLFLHLLRLGLDKRERPARAVLAAGARTAAVAALPMAVMVAIRRLVVPNKPDSFWVGIVDSMGFRLAHAFDSQLYLVTIGAFGVLLPLALLFPRRVPSLAARHFDRAAYVLSVYATLTISNNNERPLAYALPALVPAALWCLRRFLAQTRLPALEVLALVVALQALFWTNQRFTEPGVSLYQPVNWTTAAAMVLGWVGAQLALRLRAAPPAAAASAALQLPQAARQQHDADAGQDGR